MKTRLLIYSIICLLSSACAEEGLFISDDGLPIEFDYQLFNTRSDSVEGNYIYDVIPKDQFYTVYAEKTDGSDYFSDLKITGNNLYTAEKKEYWPGRDATLLFTAFYPSRLTSLYDNHKKLMTGVQTGNVDILYALDTLSNNRESQGIAHLGFYHALADLSRLSIERVSMESDFKEEEENYEILLHKVAMEFNTRGNFNLKTGEWSEIDNPKEFILTPEDSVAMLEMYELFSNWSDGEKPSFFIPQEVGFKVYITLLHKENDTLVPIFGDGVEGTPLYALISGFNAGSRIHLCLQLSVKSILDKIEPPDSSIGPAAV